MVLSPGTVKARDGEAITTSQLFPPKRCITVGLIEVERAKMA